MDDALLRQYESYPYPQRDPADEADRLIVGAPSHLLEINHYVFGGRADASRPWRVLVAGGGTGDGMIMLAQQAAWRESPVEIVYLDLSRSALEIARARAEARGLGGIHFIDGSIEDLPRLGLGRFDYIDCCGVLHHLPSPDDALATLADSLDDGGGMGLMVYGRYGRTGVYETQEALRLLCPPDEDDAARITFARRLCGNLPPTHWLRRNRLIGDHLKGGDAGLYDLLLHSRDRAYTVPEVFALAESAGLAITGFIEPALYLPETFVKDDAVTERARALAWRHRCALAELLGGQLKTHVFYVVKARRRDEAVARPDDPDVVPVMREVRGVSAARRLKESGKITADIRGVRLEYSGPSAVQAILALVDGKRSLAEMHRMLDDALPDGLEWPTFMNAFNHAYTGLNGLNLMLLSHRSQPVA